MRYTARSVSSLIVYLEEKWNARKDIVAGEDNLVGVPDIPLFLLGEWWDNPSALYAFAFSNTLSPEEAGQRNGIYTDDVTLGLRYKVGADLSNIIHVYTFATALIDILDPRNSLVGDPTLGNRVGACQIESIDFGKLSVGKDKSATAHGLLATLRIRNSQGAPSTS